MNGLTYDPETGRIFRDGKRIGCLCTDHRRGYSWRQVKHEGKSVSEARLIWRVVTGEWPAKEIDHINGDATDNRWCNLRLVTREQQCRNRKTFKNNKLGIKGVRFIERLGKYEARVSEGGKYKYLGLFECPELAGLVASEYAAKVFGEYVRGA